MPSRRRHAADVDAFFFAAAGYDIRRFRFAAIIAYQPLMLLHFRWYASFSRRSIFRRYEDDIIAEIFTFFSY